MPASTPNHLIETLSGMLDELCSPEMTLSRSRVVRSRLVALLDTMNSDDPGANLEMGPSGMVGTGTPGSARPSESQESLHQDFTAIPLILQRPCVR
jgi:hypothetical protein